ncbi:dienelactone hydrolase family protein [Alcanivorax hongdengensis A-11-3]|uniref:Dienelactone hydrolase family protein n=1 Tax=Alcanivorax hongdengensis A-11-3 TaxID=1177179 RepID=L0WH51_9GAMM|nr:dienelactone hydrolase family protein [Alcanivorax hongdengensis]EKF75170.1 dienelactone hydrolase family protein [Alcanivorax hongdengensis A-11-3]
MKNEPVEISLPGGHTMRARWIRPATPNPHGAGIIAIHDIFGFTDDIERIGKRLADNGYPVLVPDLYDLPGSKPLCVVKTLRAHETGKGFAFEQLEACREWLLAQQEEKVSQVGVMGFCMGGRFALLYASRAPVQVVAPFYGGVPGKASDLSGICPVVGGWGRKDMVFGNHGDRLAGHLQELGVEFDVKTYPDAGHSYMNNHQTFVFKRLADYSPLRSKYHEPSAEDSWHRVFNFFERVFARQAA